MSPFLHLSLLPPQNSGILRREHFVNKISFIHQMKVSSFELLSFNFSLQYSFLHCQWSSTIMSPNALMGLLFVNVLTLNGKWIWYEWSSGMTKCWIIDIMMLGCTDLSTSAALSPSPWDMHQWPNELELNLKKSLQCGKDVPAKLPNLVVLERVGVAAATSSWGRVFALIWNYLKGALRCFRFIFIMIFLGYPVPR